jgi:hypothetical protein
VMSRDIMDAARSFVTFRGIDRSVWGSR